MHRRRALPIRCSIVAVPGSAEPRDLTALLIAGRRCAASCERNANIGNGWNEIDYSLTATRIK
jgi:hypothetical protein